MENEFNKKKKKKKNAIKIGIYISEQLAFYHEDKVTTSH